MQNPGWSAQRHRRGQANLRFTTCSAQNSFGISLLTGRSQRCFAKKSPALECRAAPRAAWGGGDSRDPLGRRFSTCRPTPKLPAPEKRPLSARFFPHCRLEETGGRRHPRRKAGAARHSKTGACFDNYRRAADPENYSAPQSLSARLGDSFYFAVSKIVESLLRRGARCRSALEPGLPVATCMVRALEEIGQNNSCCLVNLLLQQSRAGAARHSKAGVGSATSYDCPARAASG